ncbi:hemolysin family protein [Clostridium pasteurianum]|uniref:CBS domain-containing protein n=1 Tax=Clostridium pasteurianum BC1 TaxID=86416 RepID=R4K4V1_CLOPA|nr:hemolysin family protein [Clostridium pasteurianum]AGK96746.1 CBS domain-containing protein [Clostridium pasteurianum BC1]
MIGEIAIIILLVIINAFFAAAEISIISLKEISIEKRASEGDKKAKLLLNILKEPSKFLATIQVGITLTSFFTSAAAAVGLSNSFEIFLKNSGIRFFMDNGAKISFIFVTIVISFFSLLFGELLPKRIALTRSEFIADKSIGIINIINIVSKPIVEALTACTNFFVRIILGKDTNREEDITEEEIKMMINVGEEKGIFQSMETKMINSIFQFDDTTVVDIMTPRPDVIALNIESDFEETIKVITEEKYSRIPVYKDNIDNIVGILYSKDIIDYMAFKMEDEKFHLNNFIKEPFFVIEYKKIDDLLRDMQKRNVHICIVIDEYGTTAGIATIEDMLEEIVGNIYDEYDEKEEEVHKTGDNQFEIDAGINMIELNQLLQTDYEENYDTVSGLILDKIGRLPKEGESIVIKDFIFKILSVKKKRIKRILITKNKDEEIIK